MDKDEEEIQGLLIEQLLTRHVTEADIYAIGKKVNELVREVNQLKRSEDEQFIKYLIEYILNVDDIGFADCNGCKKKKCIECRTEYFRKKFKKESEG